MPLVRFGVRNEYGLGVEELYKDGVQSEDPKAVLDGVAVAGLVGVLRQLGDLAQFAAEVFHGLQEQVASTSSRSRKLVNRIQKIEASLPSIEKAILSQTDHLRFAYTPGTEWHASIKNERNHFICDDLPHFIMDSYEECREPPRLQLLDRFDTGGPGTCLKRYTDPTFFRRASSCSEDSNNEKSQERKDQKLKKRRSWKRNRQHSRSASIINGNDRMHFSATGQGHSSLSHTGSAFDLNLKSDLEDRSHSRDSKDGNFVHIVSRPSISTEPDATKYEELSSSTMEAEANTNRSTNLYEFTSTPNDKTCNHDVEATFPHSSSATWDEKLEMLEHMNENRDINDARQQVPLTHSSLRDQEFQIVSTKATNQENDITDQGSSPTSRDDRWHRSTTADENLMVQLKSYKGLDEVPHFLKPNFDIPEHHLKPIYLEFEPRLINLSTVVAEKLETKDLEPGGAMDDCIGGSSVRAIEWDQKEAERVTSDHVSEEDAKIIEWNHLDLKIVNSEHFNEGDASSEDGSNVNVIGWRQMELETFDADHVNHDDDSIYEGRASSEGGNNVKLLKWNEWELETQSNKHIGQVEVIEWNQDDDIDSGTENFVDALNTIESESENDFESEMKRVQPRACKDALGEYAMNGLLADIESRSKPEPQSLLTSYVQTKMEVVRETTLKDEEVANGTTSQTAEDLSHVEPKQSQSTSYHHKKDSEELATVRDSVCSPNLDAPVLDQPSHSELESDQKEERETAVKDGAANIVSGQTAEISSHVESEQHLSMSNHPKEDIEELEKTTDAVSSRNLATPGLNQPSHEELESTADQKLDLISKIAFSRNPDFCTKEPEIEVEHMVSEVTKLGFEAPGDEGIISAPHMSEGISIGSSTTHPLAFWTNGTLLGLQPSKPTVVSVPNSVDSGTTSKIDKVGQCSLDAMQKKDDFVGTSASSINGQHRGTSKHLPHQRLEMAQEKSAGHDNSSSFDQSAFLDSSYSNSIPHESKVLSDSNVKNASSEASNDCKDRSSLLSLLSRGLLRNNLRRSGSLGYDESLKSISPVKSNYSNSRYQDTIVSESRGKLNSPVHSPPPSPPLEHMKISFQPADGFDTSRLKLKYPEGVDHIENTLDAFPSFQLVPESFSLQHDMGSDSDDDTFCQSHAYVSDESHSHLSDSDSEQWESRNSMESNDPTLYNGLHRISSAESASISPRHGADHGNVHLLSGSSLGVAVLDGKNSIAYQDMKLSLKQGVVSSNVQEPTHEPPPLPPLQWRVSRPQFAEAEGNKSWGCDTLSQPFVPNHSDPAIAHLAQVDSTKLRRIVQESSTIATTPKVEEERLGQEQSSHIGKAQRMDDGGDFLQQIRTKSFNLKRAEPTRPTYAPLPTTNNKITAILQKANAIRQAVGSDDGEDSWSDT